MDLYTYPYCCWHPNNNQKVAEDGLAAATQALARSQFATLYRVCEVFLGVGAAGKSTMAQALTRIVEIESGSIEIDGIGIG